MSSFVGIRRALEERKTSVVVDDDELQESKPSNGKRVSFSEETSEMIISRPLKTSYRKIGVCKDANLGIKPKIVKKKSTLKMDRSKFSSIHKDSKSSKRRNQILEKSTVNKLPAFTIEQRDALEFLQSLPSNHADAVITSPPYNKHHRQSTLGITRRYNVLYNDFQDSVTQEEYEEDQIRVLNEAFRVVKPGGNMFYVHKLQYWKKQPFSPLQWLRKTNWEIRNEIVWNRCKCMNTSSYRFFQKDERIYWLHKPKDPDTFELIPEVALWGSIWTLPRETFKRIDEGHHAEIMKQHPARFPMFLVLCMLHALKLRKNSKVIDPYMGSGTTAVACKLMGYSCIGSELDDLYIENSKTRLREEFASDRFFYDLFCNLRDANKLTLTMLSPEPVVPRLLQQIKTSVSSFYDDEEDREEDKAAEDLE